jgi:oligopeptide transport system substrate-binding protein
VAAGARYDGSMRLILTIAILCAVLVGSLLLDRPASRADLTAGYISIETLDPQLTRASEDIRIAYALFEGLCTFDPYTFKVVPGVAQSWDLSDDGRTYTFHLRGNAKWSDGSPVRAQDFAYSWRMGLMPDTAPPYMDFLHYIRGGKAFTDWCIEELARIRQLPVPGQLTQATRRAAESQAKFDQMVGVRVLDDRTLQVQIERPTPYFLEMVASWPFFPLHPLTLEQATALNADSLMLRRDPQWTEARRMVNNGPYRLADHRFKRYIRLVANPLYWAADRVGPRTVQVTSFNDPMGMFNGYMTGAVDIMFNAQTLPFAPDIVAEQRAGHRDDLVEANAFGTYYYCFNTRPTLPSGAKNPFADVRVRRAFAMAVDKASLVNEVTRLRQTVADVFIPPDSIPGYSSPRGIGYDPQQARQALADAGYPEGRGFPPVELSYNTGGGHEPVAQAVGRMWGQVLGVRIVQAGQEWKVFLSRRQAGDFAVSRHGWFGDYSDPTTFLDLFRTGNGNNDAGYTNAVFDGLLDQAAAERDPVKRMAVLSEAERYLLEEEAALCPLYFYKTIHLRRPWVEGVNNHPRDLQFFHLMRTEPRS